MKIVRYTFIGLALFIVGMYGWYLLAIEVNRHSDFAATVIIEDTLSSNAAYDLEQLRKIELSISQKDFDSASSLVQKLIDDKIWQQKACVTEQCEAIGMNRVK